MTQIFTSFTEKEFRELLAEQVQTALQTVTGINPPVQPSKPFLTRKETSEMLGVSFPTLYLWEKAGILLPERIGRRVLYSIEEVKKAVLREKQEHLLKKL